MRSAYHLRMELNKQREDRVEASSTALAHKGWLQLWGAEVPGKVRIHSWRLLRNGLAVGFELHRRRIKGGIFCSACGREETVLHRFWSCPHSQRFLDCMTKNRSLRMFAPPPFLSDQNDLKCCCFLDWLGRADSMERDVTTLMAIYHLWLARNEA